MLTRPPTNPGIPQGAAVEPRHSVQANRIVLHQLLAGMGALLDMAAQASGYTAFDLAHWAGGNLVRWGEIERAALGERLARTDVAAD